MSRRISAIMLAACMLGHCGSARAADAHSTRLLTGGDAPAENDQAERGLPWLSLRDEGQPFDRLPQWLQQLFDTDPELHRLRADLAASDAFLEHDRAERRATARTPEEIAEAEDIVGGVSPIFAYALIAEPRDRRRFLVIHVMHGTTCGSVGCMILFYVRTASRWRQVGYEGGYTVILERRRARGFPVFTIWNNHYSCTYRWNGTRFQDEPGCPDW